MKSLLLVFVGGGFGSLCRYLIYKMLDQEQFSFPYATFSVNVAGSLLLGLILGYVIKQENLSGGMILFLTTGFCGGFTTFSTFAFENQQFLKSGDYSSFLIYALGSLFLGIAAIFSGIYFSRFIS